MNIPALETHYRGYRFRSRLEARWAVFLDRLRINWEYEPEGFRLDDCAYLPDFFLPKFDVHKHGLYVEVKPIGGDFSKAKLFGQQKRILLAEGPPNFKTYGVVGPDTDCDVCFYSKYIHRMCGDHEEHRLYAAPESADCYCQGGYGADGVVTEAIYASRSARFEWGQTP